MILAMGATGGNGTEILDLLAAGNVPARDMVRSAAEPEGRIEDDRPAVREQGA